MCCRERGALWALWRSWPVCTLWRSVIAFASLDVNRFVQGEIRMRRVQFWRSWPLILSILLGSVMAASRSSGQAPDLPTAVPAGHDTKAASANHSGLAPVELASRLESAKQQEERLDIELRSGKSYIRCKLLRLDRAGASGPPKTLRVELDESQKSIVVDFAAIRSLTIGREVMYQAAVDKQSAPTQRPRRRPRRPPRLARNGSHERSNTA